MAHSWFCTCNNCMKPSFGYSTSKASSSKKYGPNQKYYGGRGKPDGPGHAHYNPNNGFNRRPVTNPLGNQAVRGTFGRPLGRSTPKW